MSILLSEKTLNNGNTPVLITANSFGVNSSSLLINDDAELQFIKIRVPSFVSNIGREVGNFVRNAGSEAVTWYKDQDLGIQIVVGVSLLPIAIALLGYVHLLASGVGALAGKPSIGIKTVYVKTSGTLTVIKLVVKGAPKFKKVYDLIKKNIAPNIRFEFEEDNG